MTQHGFLSAVVTYKDGRQKVLANMKKNLLTDAGKAWVHAQLYTNTSAGTRGAGLIASTQSVITPAAANTTLSGEIVDANGLARADAGTKNYTAASSSTLIEHTFNITGAYTDVKASAIFIGAGAVTMPNIATFATTSGALSSGDTLKISWTLNAS